MDNTPNTKEKASGSNTPLWDNIKIDNSADTIKTVKSRKLQSQRLAEARRFCGYIYFFITPPNEILIS
jgi:hypothetical protein